MRKRARSFTHKGLERKDPRMPSGLSHCCEESIVVRGEQWCAEDGIRHTVFIYQIVWESGVSIVNDTVINHTSVTV